MTGGKIFLKVAMAKRKRGIWIFPDWGKKQEIYQKNKKKCFYTRNLPPTQEKIKIKGHTMVVAGCCDNTWGRGTKSTGNFIFIRVLQPCFYISDSFAKFLKIHMFDKM